MSPEAIDALVAAGVTAEQLAMAIKAELQVEAEKLAERRAKAAAKKRRQRANVPGTSGDIEGQVGTSGDTPFPSRPSPPDPPNPPTHTPGYISRARPLLAKPNGFARFWEAYPRKVGKGAAERAYAKALLAISGPDPPSLLLAALEHVKPTWRSEEAQFIPHASTWLNERRWEDEPETNIRALKPNERPDPKLEQRNANLARAQSGFEIAVGLRRGGF